MAVWVEELGRELTSRQLEIWEGRSGLTPEAEEAYRRRWRGKVATDLRRSGIPRPKVEECEHRGRLPTTQERVELKLAPGKDWRLCGAGLGFACPCKGCGPNCPRYVA